LAGNHFSNKDQTSRSISPWHCRDTTTPQQPLNATSSRASTKTKPPNNPLPPASQSIHPNPTLTSNFGRPDSAIRHWASWFFHLNHPNLHLHHIILAPPSNTPAQTASSETPKIWYGQ
jgi:hypothetical protein